MKLHELSLSHFSMFDKIEEVTSTSQSRHDKDGFMKPFGFWISVDGEQDWPTWCLSETFRGEKLRYRHRVVLKAGAPIVYIQTREQLRAFSDVFKDEKHLRDMRIRLGFAHNMNIMWQEVEKQYHGIIIAPYQWGSRMDDQVFWYYSWDCASGCIWNADAIESVTLIETTDLPERIQKIRSDYNEEIERDRTQSGGNADPTVGGTVEGTDKTDAGGNGQEPSTPAVNLRVRDNAPGEFRDTALGTGSGDTGTNPESSES